MTRLLPALLVSLLAFSWSVNAQTNQAKNSLLGIGSYDLIDPGLHCTWIEREPGSYDFVRDFSPLTEEEASNEFVRTRQEVVFVFGEKTYEGYVDAPYCYAWEGECTSDSELLWSYTIPFEWNDKQKGAPKLVSIGDFVPAGLQGRSLPLVDTEGVSCAGLYLDPWPNPWNGSPQGYRQSENIPDGPTQCMTIFSSDSAHVQIMGVVRLKSIKDVVGAEELEKYSFPKGQFDNTWIADMSQLQLLLSMRYGNQKIDRVIQFQPDQYQHILNAMHSRLKDWVSGSREREATIYYNPEIDAHLYLLFSHGHSDDKYYTFLKIDLQTNTFELLEQQDPKDAWCH